ncbi:MerR/CueR family transcriptional regulator domain-containing protein [Cupriavidus sp. HMR-1]|uniref:MerR family transcriptional regulator n=1 Tax=Cupriavidus sp. HMR-1 TaxID=1249621 RepID=UPI0002A3A9B6|nr:MerR family transcriptional regulator [Cupriavidus sp. HMR-1]EKZ99593.1 MerR/CueR family transcriptional regulator domain-containing protein [Cupriavidus sp. HMR-1]
MKIGELARLSGVAASRIRFYEASGLLQPVQRQANGYREYAPETLTRLEIILRAQNAGFSLDEIRAILPTHLNDWPRDKLIAVLRRKAGEIELLEQRLAGTRRDLLTLAHDIENLADDEDCSGHAQRVLGQMDQRSGR